MASKTAKIALATNVMENHFGDKWFRLSREQVSAHCSNLGKVDRSEIKAAIKIIDGFRNSDIEKKHSYGRNVPRFKLALGNASCIRRTM